MSVLSVRPSPFAPEAFLLVLHGGREAGVGAPGRVNLPLVRMLPFERAVARAVGPALGVAEVRYRHRGWNGERADAAVDAEAALGELTSRHPGVPVVLLGHSMGGRAALRAADHPAVSGVVALAPWCPEGEPVAQLRGKRVLVVHSDRDGTTSPQGSYELARRARAEGGAEVCRIEIPGSDHAMLRHAPDWHRAAATLTGGLLAKWPLPGPVERALRLTGTDASGLNLRMPLFGGRRSGGKTDTGTV